MIALDEFRSALEGLERTANERFPQLTENLRPPASEDLLDSIDAELAPYRLPEWLRVLYQWHDGDATSRDPDLFLFRFLPVDEALELWRKNSLAMVLARPFLFEPFLTGDTTWLVTLDCDGQRPHEHVYRNEWMDVIDPWFVSPTEMVTRLRSLIDEAHHPDDLAIHAAIRRLRSDGGLHGGGDMQFPVSWHEAWRQRAGIREPLVEIESAVLLGQGQYQTLPSRLDSVGPFVNYLTPGDDPDAILIGGERVKLADPELLSRLARKSAVRLRVVLWFDPDRLDRSELRINDLQFCTTE